MGGCLSHLLSAARKAPRKPQRPVSSLDPVNEEIQCFREEHVRTPRPTANRRY